MRRSSPEDTPSLALIHAAAFDTPWSERALGGFMADAGAITLVAGAPPNGFILVRAMAGEAEVLTIAVAPDARRRGVGAALVQAAAIAAYDAGAGSLFLEVAEDNAAALTLYQSLGFRQVGRRAGYYHRRNGAMDALVLKRDLAANGSQQGPGA